MGGLRPLIGTVMEVAGELVNHVVELAGQGKMAEARAAVERFRAATRAELDRDKQSAIDLLPKS